MHGPFWALLKLSVKVVASKHCCVDAVVEHTCPEKQLTFVWSQPTFASRQKAVVKVRAASLIQLLRSLHHLLSLILTPSVEEAAAEQKPGKHGSHVDVPGLQRFVTQLFAQQPALTKELLTRLLHKCSKGIKALHGRKGAALVEACELAARSDPNIQASSGMVGTAMKATVAVAKAGPQAVAGVAVGLARGVSQAAGLGESQKPRSISMGEASPMSAGSPGSESAATSSRLSPPRDARVF